MESIEIKEILETQRLSSFFFKLFDSFKKQKNDLCFGAELSSRAKWLTYAAAKQNEKVKTDIR